MDRLSAAQVMERVREKTFREPAHAWLYEVRNGTGYRFQDRYADALVISCWPSRGVWFAGLEVKVARSDWLRELDDPCKSAEIQKFCDYWWVAAPEGVVELGEVPERWGLLTIKGKRVARSKEAPRLDRAELAPDFVASCLRNLAAKIEHARSRGFDAGYQKAAHECGNAGLEEMQAKLVAAERRAREADLEAGNCKRESAMLREAVRIFEHAAALPPNTVASGAYPCNGQDRIGGYFKAAQELAAMPMQELAWRAEKLEAAAKALREAVSVTEKRGAA